jgi:hypothetical protein
MEFAAALNISAGGALLHTQMFFPLHSLITVRVPLSPALGREHREQQIQARVLRFEARDRGFNLAVEFAKSLISAAPPRQDLRDLAKRTVHTTPDLP